MLNTDLFMIKVRNKLNLFMIKMINKSTNKCIYDYGENSLPLIESPHLDHPFSSSSLKLSHQHQKHLCSTSLQYNPRNQNRPNEK